MGVSQRFPDPPHPNVDPEHRHLLGEGGPLVIPVIMVSPWWYLHLLPSPLSRSLTTTLTLGEGLLARGLHPHLGLGGGAGGVTESWDGSGRGHPAAR